MSTERVPAHATDSETTGVIQAVDTPLPPYAQPPAAQSVAPVAPAPPPPGYAAPSTHNHQNHQNSPTVADAMVAISMPPLAAPAAALNGSSTPVGTPGVGSATATTTLLAAPVEDLTPLPSTTAAVLPPPATEVITCPECGTTAQVTLNRRESVDFCRNCDYPLFWTPSKILRGLSDSTDESLRRLPGQAGRVTVASLPCPFCYEPNALSAQTCIRCHRPMHPVEEPPPPAPVYVPPPAPVVVEEPSKVAWWVWALLALGAAALITLVVLIGTGTIG